MLTLHKGVYSLLSVNSHLLSCFVVIETLKTGILANVWFFIREISAAIHLNLFKVSRFFSRNRWTTTNLDKCCIQCAIFTPSFMGVVFGLFSSLNWNQKIWARAPMTSGPQHVSCHCLWYSQHFFLIYKMFWLSGCLSACQCALSAVACCHSALALWKAIAAKWPIWFQNCLCP